jgi:hypothetical protein
LLSSFCSPSIPNFASFASLRDFKHPPGKTESLAQRRKGRKGIATRLWV